MHNDELSVASANVVRDLHCEVLVGRLDLSVDRIVRHGIVNTCQEDVAYTLRPVHRRTTLNGAARYETDCDRYVLGWRRSNLRFMQVSAADTVRNPP